MKMVCVTKNYSQKEFFTKMFKLTLAKNESQQNVTSLTSQKLAIGRINFFNTLIPGGNKKSNTLKKKQLVKPAGLFKYVYSIVTTGPQKVKVVPYYRCVFFYLVG